MVLFRALFLAAAADCFLNGPGAQTEKSAALALCVVAVALNAQLAFVVAELAWFAVFAKAHLEAAKAPSMPAAAAAAVVVSEATTTTTSTGEPQPPPELKRLVDESKALLKTNIAGTTSSDGETWTLAKERDGVRIYSCKFPGQSFMRWRVETDEFYGPSKAMLDELFDYGKRCGANGWDAALTYGKVCKEYAGGYKVVHFATAPAAGGMVTSRDFVEARHVEMLPEGGAFIASAGLDEKKHKALVGSAFPKGLDGATRGLGFPGSGVQITPAPGAPNDVNAPRKHRFVLVTASSLGGWLPTSLVNSATGDALVDSTLFTIQYLRRKFAAPSN